MQVWISCLNLGFKEMLHEVLFCVEKNFSAAWFCHGFWAENLYFFQIFNSKFCLNFLISLPQALNLSLWEWSEVLLYTTVDARSNQILKIRLNRSLNIEKQHIQHSKICPLKLYFFWKYFCSLLENIHLVTNLRNTFRLVFFLRLDDISQIYE